MKRAQKLPRNYWIWPSVRKTFCKVIPGNIYTSLGGSSCTHRGAHTYTHTFSTRITDNLTWYQPWGSGRSYIFARMNCVEQFFKCISCAFVLDMKVFSVLLNAHGFLIWSQKGEYYHFWLLKLLMYSWNIKSIKYHLYQRTIFNK
jgi:hypothetical protein